MAEMARDGIRADRVLIEHDGWLTDVNRGQHPIGDRGTLPFWTASLNSGALVSGREIKVKKRKDDE